MNKQQRTIEEISKEITKEKLSKLYLEDALSLAKICKQCNICPSTLNKLIEKYELTRNSTEIQANSLKQKHLDNYNKIKEKITRDLLYQYYIEEDHDYYSTIKHFDVSGWIFDRLLNDYEIKKDKSKSRQKGIRTSIEKYGRDNFNNWRKGHETRIQNSGSLEQSYIDTHKKARETCLEKYGVACLFNSKNIKTFTRKKYTKPNENFRKLLIRNNIEIDNEKDREQTIGNFTYDFRVKDILIEVNPTITHNSDFLPWGDHKGIDIKYHLNKTKNAIKNNFRCIHVWDWDDKQKIIDLLANRETIYARKCEVKLLERNESDNFLNKYHLQGAARCSIRLGLIYNNEIVAIMTFGKPRYNKNYQYELIRFCSSKNIIGGAEKLFKHFINSYNVTSVISYCDNSKFSGKTYHQLGFSLKTYGTPTAHWYSLKTGEHYTDGLLRQQGFSRLIHHCNAAEDDLDTDNNTELMLREGFCRVYDCGQSTYVWNALN